MMMIHPGSIVSIDGYTVEQKKAETADEQEEEEEEEAATTTTVPKSLKKWRETSIVYE